MRFVVVNPFTQNITPIDCADVSDAVVIADLKPKEVDHGVVMPGLGIIVHEYSLFASPHVQAYFTINNRLFAGNAVLYQFNGAGETINIKDWPPVAFLRDEAAVERNIALGLVERPQLSANGVLIWQWPQPRII